LLLLNAKATITATAFVAAVSGSNEQTCRTFIEFKADVNAQSISYGLFPLLEAAHQNNVSICALLLQARANPDLAQRCRRTSLIRAAASGFCEIVELLLHSRARVSKQDEDGLSALHFAACFGHRHACLLLLRAAAANNVAALLDSKTKNGTTAVQEAAAEKHVTTTQLLRDWRAVDAFPAGSRKSWLAPTQQQQQHQEQYCLTCISSAKSRAS
jgi:ankyrin repeat protein